MADSDSPATASKNASLVGTPGGLQTLYFSSTSQVLARQGSGLIFVDAREKPSRPWVLHTNLRIVTIFLVTHALPTLTLRALFRTSAGRLPAGGCGLRTLPDWLHVVGTVLAQSYVMLVQSICGLPPRSKANGSIQTPSRFDHSPNIELLWWEQFNDPILNGLVLEAYNQNLSLRDAGFRVLASRVAYNIKVGGLFPQS